MRVRYYVPHDYEMIKSWWDGYKFHPPGIEMLPQTGLIVDDCCAAFIYKTDSPIVWMEWVVGNPNKSKEERSASLDYLIECVKIVSSLMGAKAIFTSASNKSLINKLESHGIKKGDENVTQFIYLLEG